MKEKVALFVIENQPIGIFDSGVGGLATLKYLQAQYPSEHYIYVADEAHFPYGNKTKEELIEIITKNINYLREREVKLIIVACNTASSVLPELAIKFDIPLFGVIAPTVKAVKNIPDIKSILILATEYTVNSEAYKKPLSDYQVTQLICNDFAHFAEAGDFHNPLIRKVLEDKTDHDVVVLGCTHYSFLKDEVKATLPKSLLIESSQTVINDLQSFTGTKTKGFTEILTTGELNVFTDKVERLKIDYDDIREIDIS